MLHNPLENLGACEIDAAFQNAGEYNSVTPRAVFQMNATAMTRTRSYHSGCIADSMENWKYLSWLDRNAYVFNRDDSKDSDMASFGVGVYLFRTSLSKPVIFTANYMGTIKVLSHKNKGQHLQLSDIAKKPSQQVIHARKVKCHERVL